MVVNTQTNLQSDALMWMDEFEAFLANASLETQQTIFTAMIEKFMNIETKRIAYKYRFDYRAAWDMAISEMYTKLDEALVECTESMEEIADDMDKDYGFGTELS